MAEHVILLAGPMGAGKSTAIRALSDVPVVSTEVANTDRATADKDTTTVALDYGELTIGPDEKVRLYGAPGQQRFDFMWSILQKRAIGLVLLVHADVADPEALVTEQLTAFADLVARGGLVVGVTRADLAPRDVVDRVHAVVAAATSGRSVPVFTVDARDPGQMAMVLMALVADIEARADLMEIHR